MRLKMELEPETAEALIEAAVAERRPVGWEAEVLLRRALGLPTDGQRAGCANPNCPRREEAAA